jgi:UDP-N-acetylmuramoylalanine--D-glutamate ligase
VPLSEPAIAAAHGRGIPVLGEIELASRWLRGRIIAITGTKGKSTTTTLTARMLERAGLDVTAGGNLGTALSSQVADSRPDAVHVVEVSSFQLESISTFHPWIAVFLNLSPDHLDRHASYDEYVSAKARIFSNQTADDWAVVNGDDPVVVALARAGRARQFQFGFGSTGTDGVTIAGDHIVSRAGGDIRPLVPLSAVHLPGRHLLADVMAAAAVGVIAGVPPAAMTEAVHAFAGLEHALERVGAVDGVHFVNDSKATNVISAQRAIESFETGVVPILGGRYKGGDFSDLAEAIGRRSPAVVALGEAADRIVTALGAVVPVIRAASMSDAVEKAFAAAPRGGTVLLSPACSSFDMFSDYRARGQAFKSAVAALAAAKAGGAPAGRGQKGLSSQQSSDRFGDQEPAAGNTDHSGL